MKVLTHIQGQDLTVTGASEPAVRAMMRAFCELEPFYCHGDTWKFHVAERWTDKLEQAAEFIKALQPSY